MCVYSWWLPSLQVSDVNGRGSDTCLTFPTGIATFSYTFTIYIKNNSHRVHILFWDYNSERWEKSVLLYHSIVKMLLKYWFRNNVSTPPLFTSSPHFSSVHLTSFPALLTSPPPSPSLHISFTLLTPPLLTSTLVTSPRNLHSFTPLSPRPSLLIAVYIQNI